MGTKEEAQQAYNAAYEQHEASYADLLEKRAVLDSFLRQEEARNRAVYMGFDPEDEAAVRVVASIADRNREAKAEVHANASSDSAGNEAVGGVS